MIASIFIIFSVYSLLIHEKTAGIESVIGFVLHNQISWHSSTFCFEQLHQIIIERTEEMLKYV